MERLKALLRPPLHLTRRAIHSPAIAAVWRVLTDAEPEPEPRPEPTPAPVPRPPVGVRRERTPNPNAMKFTCTIPVIAGSSRSFTRAAAAADNPLARALFEIPGVVGVFAVNDFVTVTRAPEVGWDALAPAVEGTVGRVLAAHGTT